MSGCMVKAKPATSVREMMALFKTSPKEATFLRSMDDWRSITKVPIDSKEHPLYGCSAKAASQFQKDLKFKDGALSTMNYGVIASEISYVGFTALLGEFGISSFLFETFLKDHKCHSRGSCVKHVGFACTLNC